METTHRPVPIVTALRAARPGQVEVHLDGVRWRVVPTDAVYRAGLTVGVALDRPRAREVGRELRRQRALGLALNALGRRAQTVAELEQRLERRQVNRAERVRTLEALEGAGLVDDGHYAAMRAALLAARGSGDLLIADDLERHGVAPELVARAVDGLEKESARAARIVAKRGATPRTLRTLAAKGFSEDALEFLVAQLQDGAIG